MIAIRRPTVNKFGEQLVKKREAGFAVLVCGPL